MMSGSRASPLAARMSLDVIHTEPESILVLIGASMDVVLVAMAASALLGLATGLVFRVWAMGPVSLIVASGSAVAANFHGYGFMDGILTVVASLVISQAAYAVPTFLLSRSTNSEFLPDNNLDDDPDNNR